MRVRALRLGEPHAPSAVVFDESSSCWVALAPALHWRQSRAALSSLPQSVKADNSLLNASRSLITLLAADPSVRDAALALVRSAAVERWDGCIVRPSQLEPLPFQPLSFRDAGLYKRHLKQSVAGFVPLMRAQGHLLQAIGMLLTKPLRLPDGLNSASRPAFYIGNPLTFIADGDLVAWPSHCEPGDYWKTAPESGGRSGCLDYELEVAVLITRPVSPRAEPEEVTAAIGGFVLINDFSARCTQADELLSVSFGFVKSKSFATSMASSVVSADELWHPGDKGQLFSGSGLCCDVMVNGEPRRGSSGRSANTAKEERTCSLEALVAFCALDEGLQPGELIGLGTVPDCCGLELNRLLRPGDEVTLRVEKLGTLTNKIGHPREGAVPFKHIDCSSGGAPLPGRLRTAARLLVSALIVPPLLFSAFVVGAIATLVWPSGPLALKGGTPAPAERVAVARSLTMGVRRAPATMGE